MSHTAFRLHRRVQRLGWFLAIALGIPTAPVLAAGPPQTGELPRSVEQGIREDKLIELTQNLIRIRSDYDEGVLANHNEMATFLAETLGNMGFIVDVIEPTPGYPTVIGRLEGSRRNPALGVLAHYNTVTAGDLDKWTVDPFGGELREGRIYGLGAADQKAAIAATIVATQAVLDAEVPLTGDLIHLYIPGEGAQVHSLPFIVKERPEVLKADWYLDTEGGPNIVKISGGWTWVKVRVSGVSAHTAGGRSDGKVGRPVNAIYELARVLTAIENIDSWMSYEKHPLFPNPTYQGRPVVEAGKIAGGYKVNQVPDWAEAQLDIRLLPGQSPAGVIAELRSLFERLKTRRPELDVTVEPMTTQWVPLHYWDSLTDDDAFVQAIREIAPAYLGRVPGWTGSIGGGRPDLWQVGAKWVNFGIEGSGSRAHSPNEYASVDAAMNRARLYAALILRMLE